MTVRLDIHPESPQGRLIRQAADVLRDGGLIVYPTDSCYALGCMLDAADGARNMSRVRQTDKTHNFTLICHDLSEVSAYVKVPNWAYRLVKANTPGPFTFILPATRDVPRRLLNQKRNTIGFRLPDHADSEGAFTDVAAIIKNLDTVVTTDTAVAHLAGAVGADVHVLLGKVPDWRWGTEGDRTPWYPTMKLHRQETLGDWSSVVKEVL